MTGEFDEGLDFGCKSFSGAHGGRFDGGVENAGATALVSGVVDDVGGRAYPGTRELVVL
jgi:hypothetical protein